MNNKVKYLLVVLITLIVFFMIYYFLNTRKSSGTFEIVQNTNAGVPYKWEYEIKNKNIVKYVKTTDIDKSPKNYVGGRVEQHYVFKALKPGNTVIRFRYLSIVNEDVDKDVTYNIYVDKNLNVKVK